MTFGRSTQKQLLYHAAGWSIFILYEVSFVKLIRGTKAEASVWLGYIFPYMINMGLFYFHSFVTLNKGWVNTQKRMVLFPALIFFELLTYLFLMGLDVGRFPGTQINFLFSIYHPDITFIQQVWRAIYFLIFSSAFWMIHRSFENEKKLKEAETTALLKQHQLQDLELKLISTKNAFLQAQINPHLLFNTLNFIHSEVQHVSEKASDAIIVLSEMMRYSLAETRADGKVLLHKELEQINNLILINQFRFNNQLYISQFTDINSDDARIIPLLLVPFIENLFKYAELRDPDHPVEISIILREHTLSFFTTNKKRSTKPFRSPGIGIANVKKRLETHYPGQHSLDICNTPSTFTVHLTIEV